MGSANNAKTSAPISGDAAKGHIFSLLTFVLWGGFPIFWEPVTSAGMSAGMILAFRIVWSAAFAVLFLLASGQIKAFIAFARNKKMIALFALSSALMAANWLVYLYALAQGEVLQASLGYFINPLVSVVLGFVVLKERLLPLQALAALIALAAVTYLALSGDGFPWLSLGLAFSFGFYGLARKMAPAGSLHGLALETLWMFPFALGYIVFSAPAAATELGRLSALGHAVLIASGLATTVPLLLFAAAAKKIPLSTLGIYQYISPTMQFFIGLLYFHEAFSAQRLAGYSMVWAAVLLYAFAAAADSARRRKAGKARSRS